MFQSARKNDSAKWRHRVNQMERERNGSDFANSSLIELSCEEPSEMDFSSISYNMTDINNNSDTINNNNMKNARRTVSKKVVSPICQPQLDKNLIPSPNNMDAHVCSRTRVKGNRNGYSDNISPKMNDDFHTSDEKNLDNSFPGYDPAAIDQNVSDFNHLFGQIMADEIEHNPDIDCTYGTNRCPRIAISEDFFQESCTLLHPQSMNVCKEWCDSKWNDVAKLLFFADDDDVGKQTKECANEHDTIPQTTTPSSAVSISVLEDLLEHTAEDSLLRRVLQMRVSLTKNETKTDKVTSNKMSNYHPTDKKISKFEEHPVETVTSFNSQEPSANKRVCKIQVVTSQEGTSSSKVPKESNSSNSNRYFESHETLQLEKSNINDDSSICVSVDQRMLSSENDLNSYIEWLENVEHNNEVDIPELPLVARGACAEMKQQDKEGNNVISEQTQQILIDITNDQKRLNKSTVSEDADSLRTEMMTISEKNTSSNNFFKAKQSEKEENGSNAEVAKESTIMFESLQASTIWYENDESNLHVLPKQSSNETTTPKTIGTIEIPWDASEVDAPNMQKSKTSSLNDRFENSDLSILSVNSWGEPTSNSFAQTCALTQSLDTTMESNITFKGAPILQPEYDDNDESLRVTNHDPETFLESASPWKNTIISPHAYSDAIDVGMTLYPPVVGARKNKNNNDLFLKNDNNIHMNTESTLARNIVFSVDQDGFSHSTKGSTVENDNDAIISIPLEERKDSTNTSESPFTFKLLSRFKHSEHSALLASKSIDDSLEVVSMNGELMEKVNVVTPRKRKINRGKWRKMKELF